MQGRPGVSDVVGDEHPPAPEVGEVRGVADEHRLGQRLADIGVELDIHMPHVLEVERVRDAGSNEQPASDNTEHSVRDPPLVDELLREPSNTHAEVLIREDLELRLGRQVRCHAPAQTWVRWKLANDRDGVGPRCPW